MTAAFPGAEKRRAPEDVATPLQEGVDLFAQIEGLVGEECALLAIPLHKRSKSETTRLREIAETLDRIFDKLRERAEVRADT
jgi:phenylalanyl-tRNA synthetase beta subunit